MERRIRDATDDGRVNASDTTQAALRWVMAHADHGGCERGAGSAVDAIQDGCVDIADVQSFAAVPQTAALAAAAAANPPFVVNSTADGADATPGDGVCSTTSATCTLRAAMQEANAQPGVEHDQFRDSG